MNAVYKALNENPLSGLVLCATLTTAFWVFLFTMVLRSPEFPPVARLMTSAGNVQAAMVPGGWAVLHKKFVCVVLPDPASDLPGYAVCVPPDRELPNPRVSRSKIESTNGKSL